jgi:TatD DNase family protein
MSCIDIGPNLMSGQFDRDRMAVLERSKTSGVFPFIITGANSESSREASDFCEKYNASHNAPDQKLYSTAGIHPHDAKTFAAGSIPALKALLEKPHVAAVGECGLDYDRDYSPREKQRECFGAQLRLAAEVKKPLFLHQRNEADGHSAFDDFYAMLKNAGGALPHFVVHCFTGNRKELEAFLSLGAYIGITGWVCDERRGKELQSIVSLIPSNRLMIETDAPYLLPRNMPKAAMPKNRRNEPCFLPWVAKKLAEIRKEDISEFTAKTEAATRAFFQI